MHFYTMKSDTNDKKMPYGLERIQPLLTVEQSRGHSCGISLPKELVSAVHGCDHWDRTKGWPFVRSALLDPSRVDSCLEDETAMTNEKGITQYFGADLAAMLSEKLLAVFPDFNHGSYIAAVEEHCGNLGYSARVELHADEIQRHLPDDFVRASRILISILGEENEDETGMFSKFYWIMPIGKYIEKYGLQHFEQSMSAIEAITKRNTGEYAIRPFIRRYPEQALRKMMEWARSENFHLRRLASEGLRPKLPWATKLDTFVNQPKPVFAVLEVLKEDEVMFVKKSVANHLTDWLKVNREPTAKLLKRWRRSDNKHTQWIIQRATRKIDID